MTAMQPSSRIHGGTRTVGIIGWPVSHSLSPAIHNAAFAALDLDWTYVPLPVAPGEAVEARLLAHDACPSRAGPRG